MIAVPPQAWVQRKRLEKMDFIFFIFFIFFYVIDFEWNPFCASLQERGCW